MKEVLVRLETLAGTDIVPEPVVTGTVAVVGSNQHPAPFVGWVQLLGLLEAISAGCVRRD